MKYIESVKLADISRLSVVFSRGRTMEQVKAATGCDLILNGGLYDKTGKPVCHLKVDGIVEAKEAWSAQGYAWTTGKDLQMVSIPEGAKAYENYITCVALLTPLDGLNTKLEYPSDMGGTRGRTALALTADRLILYCSKDGTGDAKTPETLRQELYDLGARTALMLDGGGSAQCDFGGSKVIKTGRNVQNYICVWMDTATSDKKGDLNMDKNPIVCLDPGHGPGTVNGSPDGTYKETEFAWDMYGRLRTLLEAQGVQIVGTREEDVKPSLTERANVSNKAGADLFVSIHSNASAGTGWSSPHGLLIYTSQAGDTAGRNKAARAVLARLTESGVELQGTGLAHYGYTVLTKTTAPAILIEYGFHTNAGDVAKLKDSAYRDKLAAATAQGICDYLGVAWKIMEAPDDDWTRATKMGLVDGTRPEETLTRAEAVTIILRALEVR